MPKAENGVPRLSSLDGAGSQTFGLTRHPIRFPNSLRESLGHCLRAEPNGRPFGEINWEVRAKARAPDPLYKQLAELGVAGHSKGPKDPSTRRMGSSFSEERSRPDFEWTFFSEKTGST